MQGLDNRPPADKGTPRTAVWPVPPASLSALVDLGMSDERIGRYFAVGTQTITALRHKYAVRREAR